MASNPSSTLGFRLGRWIFTWKSFLTANEECWKVEWFPSLFLSCVFFLSNLLLWLEESKQMTQSWVQVVEINSQPVVCRRLSAGRRDKLRHVKWPGPHYPCHYLYFPAWPDRSMGPLLTEIIQGREKDCFVTAFGKAERSRGKQRRGKVHDSAKGVAPLKLNLQLVSDKSVSSVAVGRGGWAFGGHYKLTPYFSGLLNHLLHLPLLKLSKPWWVWHCVVHS